MLVRVLSRLQADALILERAEDVVGPVVLREVLLFLGEVLSLLSEVAVGDLEGGADGADEGRFLARDGVVGEDAVGNEPDAEEVEGAVEEGAGEKGG